MNVAIVDGDISYPPTSGKRLRTLNLMLRLADRHRITYLARGAASSTEAREAKRFLGDHGIDTVVIDDPVPAKKGLSFYARLAGNLLSSLPYSVATHHSDAMRRAVQQHAAQHPVDVWQFEWVSYADTLPDPQARRVLVAHNVESLIWQRYCETETHPLKRWFIRQQWRKFERYEGRVFREVTRVVAVSEEDARLAHRLFGADNIDVVENGIDRAYYESVEGRRDPTRILFLGSLEWRPNLDAIALMLDQVFPAVLAAVPAARLVIVGRNPPAWLRDRAAGMANVELHASVADVRPYLGDCGVMAVPLRIGGGSRLKILESLAAGLPVVSTRIGAEGLCLEPGRDLVVVERVEDLAAALVEAVRNPEPIRAMAEHGRQVVGQRCDWGPLADKLDLVWRKCVTGEQA